MLAVFLDIQTSEDERAQLNLSLDTRIESEQCHHQL